LILAKQVSVAMPFQIRKIEPCAILSTENKWILMAWCHLRKDYRAFRIDRIQHFKILQDKFEDRKFSLRDYYKANPYNHKKSTKTVN